MPRGVYLDVSRKYSHLQLANISGTHILKLLCLLALLTLSEKASLKYFYNRLVVFLLFMQISRSLLEDLRLVF